MAFRIFARLALFMLSLSPGFAAEVRFYPVNVCPEGKNCVEGLTFFFDGATDSQARVTVTALQNGKPVTKSQMVDTVRRVDTNPMLHMLIDEAARHDLIELRIELGGRVYSLHHVHSGAVYHLGSI